MGSVRRQKTKMASKMAGSPENRVVTYLFGGDLDSDFLNSFCELVWLDDSIIVEIKVLE